MTEEYGLIKKTKPPFPVKELIRVPHKKGGLISGLFGKNSFHNNVDELIKTYSHPLTEEPIFFREPTTAESISFAAYEFGSKGDVDAKRDIFDPAWLQLGRIIRNSEGVFTNITIKDDDQLKELLGSAEKINGIWIIDENTAFAPYETFNHGVQDYKDFARGGLAKSLEHTRGKFAPKLRKMASPKNYKEGVNVFGFNPTKKPIQKVAGLISDGDGGRLYVDGDWDGDDGFAFGVLE